MENRDEHLCEINELYLAKKTASLRENYTKSGLAYGIQRVHVQDAVNYATTSATKLGGGWVEGGW